MMIFILLCHSDAISESTPRVIHEDRARKLAHELKRCTYYETCATYGLNVERAFHDGLSFSVGFLFSHQWIFFIFVVCYKVIQQRYGYSSSNRSLTPQQQSPVRMLSNSQSVPPSTHTGGSLNLTQTAPASVFSSYRYESQGSTQTLLSSPTPNLSVTQYFHTPTMNGVLKDRNNQHQGQSDKRTRSFKDQQGGKLSTLNESQLTTGQEINEQITPTSTPTQKRKESKRKSNLFTVSVEKGR